MLRAFLGLFVVVAALFSVTGCRGRSSHASDGNRENVTGTTGPSAAPPLLRDDSRDLWLTWIDSSGDFHVVESIDKVPDDAKQHVRVVVATNSGANSDLVFVADLRQKLPDQTYAVTSMSRTAWDELGATKRKLRIESLAPVASQLVPTPPTSQSAEAIKPVVIYGAKWCGACREAKKYLAKKGVKFIEKDVDESPSVQAELRAKLAKAGQAPTSSIPVIDVGGRILVGFSQGAVDAALQALKP
jgi:glutaredoxin